MTARGLRNFNPGNIKYVAGVTSTYAGCTGQDDLGFCIFDTAENGLRAACKLLLVYQDRHDLRTVRGIISRWSATDQVEYIANVAKRLNVGADTILDLHHAATLEAMVAAIVQQEDGEQPYPLDLIAQAADSALGIAPQKASEAPQSAPIPAAPIPVPAKAPMDPLTIIGLMGPLLQTVLPLVGTLFGGKKDAANAQLIGTVLNTVSQAAGTVAVGQPATLASTATAIEKMQADPAVQKSVQDAVVTHPDVITQLGIVEIGGGPAAAAERDFKVMTSDAPFWRTSAVFWVSMSLLPMIYWYVGSSVVGGTDIPESLPWGVQFALKMFGPEWDPGARVGLANLIVGLVLGGICGVYYGISVTQQKQQQQTASPEKSGS